MREAKRLIRKEFDRDFKLQSSDVIEQLHKFAKASISDDLMSIYKQLKVEDPKSSQPVGDRVKAKAKSDLSMAINGKSKEIRVGDIVDGRECVGLYRGQPVYR